MDFFWNNPIRGCNRLVKCVHLTTLRAELNQAFLKDIHIKRTVRKINLSLLVS